ncbi:MAG: hypothetical protein ACP5FH_08485, partial [Terracidiphilus sp.]
IHPDAAKPHPYMLLWPRLPTDSAEEPKMEVEGAFRAKFPGNPGQAARMVFRKEIHGHFRTAF